MNIFSKLHGLVPVTLSEKDSKHTAREAILPHPPMFYLQWRKQV